MFDDDVTSKTCKYWPFIILWGRKEHPKIQNNKKAHNVTFPRLAIISSTRLCYLSMWTMGQYIDWFNCRIFCEAMGKKAVGKHNTNLASCYTTAIMIYGWVYKQFAAVTYWWNKPADPVQTETHTHTHARIYLKYWYNICLFRFEFNWIETKPVCNACTLRYVPRRLWCL